MAEQSKSSSTELCFYTESTCVLPGDRVVNATSDLPETMRPLRVGPGITALPDWSQPQQLVATRAGRLRYAPRLHVEVDQRRYIPYVNDVVVGLVLDRVGSEHYRVDIGASTPALLPVLAFEGATKRNRPHFTTGHVVYARVTQVPTPQRYVETELSCQAPGSRKNWTSGETIFGRLVGGSLFRVSLASARQLIRHECSILEQLGRVLVFEIAIGMNGTIWIKGNSYRTTVLVQYTIEHGVRLTTEESRRLIRRILGVIEQDMPDSMDMTR
ncbi:Exosome component 3 [Cyanidiococcus yangmingshanensis]|uniref:Exosome component 3 n=1 Tax=Cyanidiococcus yangmingshanensis TaxID=2690220 RepID=A0A7J7IG45_9RHOD|nr:Exosome component 3 [Cyanidiococcus yangmingshanensis]